MDSYEKRTKWTIRLSTGELLVTEETWTRAEMATMVAHGTAFEARELNWVPGNTEAWTVNGAHVVTYRPRQK